MNPNLPSVTGNSGGVIKDRDELLKEIKKDASKFASIVPKWLKHDKDFVLEACKQNWLALEYVSGESKDNKDVVLEACKQKGSTLKFASEKLRDDKDVVLEACKQNAWALKYASEKLKDDKNVVLEACKQNWRALKYASEKLENDKDVVCVACKQNGWALQYASEKLKDDKDVVLVACKQNGIVLNHASERLRATKEIVLAAASSNPDALKYALGGLNQDRDCLIAAKLWDEQQKQTQDWADSKTDNHEDDASKIVLSTRFALKPNSESKATQFAVLLKQHEYVLQQNFQVYSPNAFEKQTCDPEWTRFDWPCRGTFDTCRKEPNLKVGVPQPQSCWRYSFRYQLEKAKESKGFMIQLVEDVERKHFWWANQTLGDGQRIESEMAAQIGTKVFRVYVPIRKSSSGDEWEQDFSLQDIDKVVFEIQEWYGGGCKNMSTCELRIYH